MRDELPSHRHTLPYPDAARESIHDGAASVFETSASARIEADIAEIKETLGRPPAPGRPGSGLVGAVMEMQRTIERLVSAEEARAKASTPLVSKRTAIALITALVGSGGIAGIIHAATGREPPPAQQQQTGRTP